MNKQTKMILGFALVGVAGYMIYTQSNKANFASAAQVKGGKMSGTGKKRHFAPSANVEAGVFEGTPKSRHF